jgi:hypothetical protein
LNGNYTAKSYLAIYDINLCVAAFDGVHTEPQDDGNCTTAVTCSMCKEHTFKDAKSHVTNERLTYTSFLEQGEYYFGCTNDGCTLGTTEKTDALFACLGYSASKTGDGISLGFKVNNGAIERYTSVTGNTVIYGVFAIAQSKLDGNKIFDENGKANEFAITAEIKATDFSAFDIKIVGFENDTQKSSKLALGAYVALSNGEISYMQAENASSGDNYHFISYAEIVK